MYLILNCDCYDAQNFPPNLETDICAISAFKWKATTLAAMLLVSLILYLQRKFRFRCQQTLLTFHNLRAAVTLLLFAINSLDVAHAFLSSSLSSLLLSSSPAINAADTGCGDNECGSGNGNGCDGNGYNFTNPDANIQQQHLHNHHLQQQQQQSDFVVIVIGAATLRNALAATLLTIVLMWYHRVVELKKSVAFLYVSVVVLASVFLLRIYEIAEIVYDHSILELEPCLQSASAACLLALAVTDGCTIYKERYKLDYFEDYEKIGYKHTLATFYSKACFWWLTPLLWFGYKEPLELDDLGQMRVEDTARAHYDRFLLIYKTAKVKNADRPPSLWLCYAKSSWRMFALGGVLKLFGDLFALIGPLAIQQIVQYIETMYALKSDGGGAGVTPAATAATASAAGGNTSTGDGISGERISSMRTGPTYGDAELKIYYPGWLDLVSNGWTVAWIVLLAALAQGAFSQGSTHILNMTGIRIKTSLQGLIYRKTLLLNASCIDERFSGGSGGGGGETADDEDEDAVELRRTGRPAAKNDENASAAKACRDKDKTPQLDNEEGGLSDVGSITNLMSEDTLNVMSFFWIAHYIWAIPLKIGVVMFLLYLKLGISAVIGSFVCILTMTPLQFLIGKAMSSNAEIVAKFTDERLRKLHDTVVGIKLIKLNAWDDVFIRRILDAREKELKYLNKDSLYWTLMTILTHISSVLIAFVTLAVYVRIESDESRTAEFTASRLFSALALFQQLTVPLLIFPITVPIIIAAVVSTQRLERFLQSREIQKQFEGIRHMARILCKSDASLDMYEVKKESGPLSVSRSPRGNNDEETLAKEENTLNESLALRLKIPDSPAPLAQSEPQTPLSLMAENINGDTVMIHDERHVVSPFFPAASLELTTKSWEEPSSEKTLSIKRKELLRNQPYVVTRPRKVAAADFHFGASLAKRYDSLHRDSLQLKTCPDDMAVSVRSGCFGWQPNRLKNALNVGSITIPKARLTVIVGRSGSGKSSLLAALLMEMPLISGDMIWNKTCTIAFVPQQPWLLNASIRENILFGESFRPKRYDFVLDACALKPDIELMPEADFTVIGERGINLSGGQRQRVAIARALYSSANVVIMDDPLSSLDNAVARHIFDQSIRRMLLKANRTVILVTQQLNLAQQADYLIVMKDGHLQASGTYKDIESKHPRIIAKWNSKIAQSSAHNENSDGDGDDDGGGGALGRTARERWKLFRNVTKLSLQRSASASAASLASCFGAGIGGGHGVGAGGGDSGGDRGDGDGAGNCDAVNVDAATSAENDDDVLPASMGASHAALRGTQSLGNFSLTPRKRSSYYGSRHLICDVPLPIDECQTEDVIFRRRRRGTTTARRRPTSSASSRLSGISDASPELRRSLLTASCSSATSYASNASNTSASTTGGETLIRPPPSNASNAAASVGVVVRQLRVQSWQPQSASADAKTLQQPIARNASTPGCFLQTGGETDAGGGSDAALVADLVKSSKPDGGFQQFLRRMSMRRANKPTAVTVLRKHRPVSATNSILSISEESATPPLLPSNELSAVVMDVEAEKEMEMEMETDSWIANIEDEEESMQDSDIDYKALSSTNNASSTRNAAAAVPPPATPTAPTAVATQGEATSKTTMAGAIDVERKYGKIPAQIYLHYLRASGPAIVLIFFGSALIWQCLRVYTDVWLQHWTDDGRSNGVEATSSHRNHQQHQEAMHQQQQQQRVTYYFRVYAAISCVCVLMAALSTPAGQLAGCNARRKLHEQLLRSIMRKSLHFFQVTPLGRIINRFSNDMAVIDKKIAATSQRLLQFTLLCLCAVLINVGITPWFILVTLPICAAYYAIQKFYRCSARELQRIDNSTNTPVISHLSETIQGVTTIRAYSQEARFTEMLFRRLEGNTIAFTILNTSNRWLGISLDYLGGVIVFLAILTALLAATISSSSNSSNSSRRNDNLSSVAASSSPTPSLSPSPSLVGLAINYTLLVPIYLNWVVKLLADMEMFVGSVERIAYYAETETENGAEIVTSGSASSKDEELGGGVEAIAAARAIVTATPGAIERNDVERQASVRRQTDRKRYKSVPISWPQRGDIAFENVSLRYEGQHDDVIKNLTLNIPSGQRIGICGRTGSGKSSLALSLFGVLQTTSGRIRIDDVDITQIHPDEIRTRLSIIPQDVHLFSGTIRENLDPPGYYSDLALWNCLEFAQLKEFVIGQLPHGLDTEIMEGGHNFSSGHRQLLCLARAILRGSVCLVLDEATSSLDTSTEMALLAAAHKAFQGRTILTIAHRLSTILDYDRIIVLEGGKIIEDGSPRDLQQRADGVFSALLHSGRPMSAALSDSARLEDNWHSTRSKEANRS